MEDIRKVKEIYDCVPIISDEELYPLQKWYNQLIDKTIHEITVADVLQMIRQKQFINLAMAKAIEFLKENVFVGELYDGEIFEKISELDSSFLVFYAESSTGKQTGSLSGVWRAGLAWQSTRRQRWEAAS